MHQQIRRHARVAAPVAAVWQAFTTSAGARTFFAPQASIRLSLLGPYELQFDEDQPEGQRGSEGCRVLAFLPDELLSFEWNAPPEFPAEREQRTFVVVTLRADGDATDVTLVHAGFGEGGNWPAVVTYFERAWGMVMHWLVHRFAHGPVDWTNPPRPG